MHTLRHMTQRFAATSDHKLLRLYPLSRARERAGVRVLRNRIKPFSRNNRLNLQ